MTDPNFEDLQLPETPGHKEFFTILWPLYNRVNRVTRILRNMGQWTNSKAPVSGVGTVASLPSYLLGTGGPLASGTPLFADESGNLLTATSGVSPVYYVGVVLQDGLTYFQHPTKILVTQ